MLKRSALVPRLKKRKCQFCKNQFMQERVGQAVCDTDCAIGLIKRKNEKKEIVKKQKTRKAKQELNENNVKWMLKKTQEDCNAYIRERDKNDGCISCDTRKNVQYCAGHYRPAGVNSALRFHPMNIHKQCNRNCNMAKSGNLMAYRPRLIKKIGLDNVEWLDNNHEIKKWTIDELRELRKMFKKLLAELKKDSVL